MSFSYEGKTPLVEMVGISKSFPGVQALSDITFNLYKGEIHCLVGENGAGKSTLMKVLSGAHSPDDGKIIIDGKPYASLSPKLSLEMGIGIIYQENDLIPTMSVAENMFVGLEKTNKFGFLDRAGIEKSARVEV